jgi:FlaA1/EpsC-like NDP-sugar epimerase
MINAEPNIVFTGKRQGEKLDEVLFDPTETRKPTVHPAISTVMVDDAIPLEDILGLCISAAEVGTDNPAAEIRDLLTTLMTNHPSAPMILET